MCGIAGKLNYSPFHKVEEGLIKAMCDAIQHRGPDDAGYYINDNIGLGHRRLSIIDINSGHQPIFNEDQSLVIVFNGEIYNFKELRTDLLNKNHSFSTSTDTEVILHLYEDHGVNCLQKLNGMFSFAIWDSYKKSLFIARDRVGIKPLYYYHDHRSFSFASELKALETDPSLTFDVDFEAIDLYFSHGYIPSPYSIYKNTHKLLPGHYLIIENGKLKTEQYWNIQYEYNYSRSKAETIATLQDLLESSVKMQMVSDVPLGAFLSGGIDSSAVVGLMSKLLNRPVKTFSIGFNVQEFNETGDAKIVSDYFHSDHHELILEPNAIDLVHKIVDFYDEPFSDSSAIPTFVVSELARKHVKVALSGDGGDELFGGYTRYIDSERDTKFLKLPHFLRTKALGFLGNALPAGATGKNYFQYISKNTMDRYAERIASFSDDKRKLFYTSDFNNMRGKPSSLTLKYLEAVKGHDALTKFMYLDCKMYLPDDILTKVDRASMAHSLEVRVPLLDHRLIEYSATIPPELKVNGLNQKFIFKEALSTLLPSSVFKKKKQGFGVPLEKWFRHELKELIYDVLLSSSSLNRGILQKKAVTNLLNDHQTGDRDNSHYLWALLCFELWHRK